MPILSTMGLKKIYFAPANSTDNTQMPTTGWKDLGDVYQDTCTFVDNDPTKTEHKSETSSKKIVQKRKEGSLLALSLMDPDIIMIAECFGGTVTGAAGSRKWTEPATPNNKEYAFMVFPEEGLCLQIPAAVITPKKNTTYSSSGITLVDIEIDPVTAISYEEGVTPPTT